MVEAKRVDEADVRAAWPEIGRAIEEELALQRALAEQGPYAEGDSLPAAEAAVAIRRALGHDDAVWFDFEHHSDWPEVSRRRIETEDGGSIKSMVRVA